jgi:hypothetical protein
MPGPYSILIDGVDRAIAEQKRLLRLTENNLNKTERTFSSWQSKYKEFLSSPLAKIRRNPPLQVASTISPVQNTEIDKLLSYEAKALIQIRNLKRSKAVMEKNVRKLTQQKEEIKTRLRNSIMDRVI